jgi:hypothetical protein
MGKKNKKSPIQELLESIEGLQDFIIHADANTMELYLKELDESDIEKLRQNVAELEDLLSK